MDAHAHDDHPHREQGEHALTTAVCELAARGDLEGVERFFTVTQGVDAGLDRQAYVETLQTTLTPLCAAVTSGNANIVSLILEHGVNNNNATDSDAAAAFFVNQPAGKRWLAPLHLAVGRSAQDLPVDVAKLLLEFRANPIQPTSDKTTPLHFACAAVSARRGASPVSTHADMRRQCCPRYGIT
jgi:hypothetical protein